MLNFARFVVTRALMAAMTLVIVSLVVFSLMELVPGDCAERYLAFKNTQGSGISVADIEPLPPEPVHRFAALESEMRKKREVRERESSGRA